MPIPQHGAECERVDRDHDVVGHDRAGALLVRFVESFPPGRFGFNIEFAKSRVDADQFRKLRIVMCAYKTEDRRRLRKTEKRKKRVAPGATEGLWQFTSKESGEFVYHLARQRDRSGRARE